jgi:hypothetical protein
MHLEPREHSKKAKDKPEKERDLSNKSGKEFKLISNLPDRYNSLRNKLVLQNKLESKEMTTCPKSKSKNKLNSKKEGLRRRRSRLFWTTPRKSEVKLEPTSN